MAEATKWKTIHWVMASLLIGMFLAIIISDVVLALTESGATYSEITREVGMISGFFPWFFGMQAGRMFHWQSIWSFWRGPRDFRRQILSAVLSAVARGEINPSDTKAY